MFISVHTATVLGLDCAAISVEVDIANGWPGFHIIGLPDAAVQEARERIRTAWKNAGFQFPYNKKIVINLAPADIRKEGTSYDLPMAVAMYATNENMEIDIQQSLFVGELSLDGKLRHTAGILPIAIYAQEHGFRALFVPKINAKEAAIVPGITVYPVETFTELTEHLRGTALISPMQHRVHIDEEHTTVHPLDMAEIKGHGFVKRALEIAASGAHNILLNGPPGSGKTLLARTFASILPQLSLAQAIEVTKIYSVAGMLSEGFSLVTERPFRAPHHSASAAALVGGGTFPKPGEISLAHRGVLFLDEFPEFPRSVLETLRQPLEDGVVTISRAQGTLSFPARFMLIASQNPCPCGFASDPEKQCACSQVQIDRYKKKISGPLLDRIDLHVEVPRIDFEKLHTSQLAENSATIRARVQNALLRQADRFQGYSCLVNSEMSPKEIRLFCKLNKDSEDLLRQAMTTLQLSARGFHRLLKVARTIADLANSEQIETVHLAEALQYRARST